MAERRSGVLTFGSFITDHNLAIECYPPEDQTTFITCRRLAAGGPGYNIAGEPAPARSGHAGRVPRPPRRRRERQSGPRRARPTRHLAGRDDPHPRGAAGLRRGHGVADDCQRRLKIRPKGGAKDCHLGWWSDLGVRLGVGDAVRGFFGGSGQRSHAELKRSAPAGRPQGGMVYRIGVSLATRALGARCRPGPSDGVPQFSYRHCFCGRGFG